MNCYYGGMEKQTLGGMIASLRKEREMTQAELAERMGITDKAVSKWERDLSCPDITTIPKLAEILGVSADELLRCRTESRKAEKKENLPLLITRAVALAMGIATAVLAIINKLDARSGFTMLGIGLLCLAISSFHGEKSEE